MNSTTAARRGTSRTGGPGTRGFSRPPEPHITMKITSKELQDGGFWRAGTVYPDAHKTLRVEMTRDAHGCDVYLVSVDDEVMKAGKTETPSRRRMLSTFNSLKNKMGGRANHPRYQEKTFKQHAQA